MNRSFLDSHPPQRAARAATYLATRILAQAISLTDDGEGTLLGFADNPMTPVNYVILQISDEPDDEEIANGWEGVHIDTGGLGVDGYDLVQDIRRTDRGVVVSLTLDAAQTAGIGQDIEIEFAPDRADRRVLDHAIQKFRERLGLE